MARDASTQPDMSQLEQLTPVESQIGAPPIPQYPPSPNPNLRSPLPTSQWLQPDNLRQFYKLGTPQNRIAPIPPNGQATINSTAGSVSKTTIQETSTATTITQNLLINVDQVSVSPYNVVQSDYERLKVFTSATPGQIILPGRVALLDVAATNSGSSATASVAATPTSTNDWALYTQTDLGVGTGAVDASQFTSGSASPAAASATATATNDFSLFLVSTDSIVGQANTLPTGYSLLVSNTNDSYISGKQLSGSGAESPSIAINNAGWGAGTILLRTAAGQSVAYRSLSAGGVSGALSQGAQTVTPAVAYLAGSAVVVCLLATTNGDAAHGAYTFSVGTDSLGNVYDFIGQVGTAGTVTPTHGFYCAAFICSSVVGGLPTIHFNVNGAVGSGFSGACFALEFTGVASISGPTGNWTDITPGGAVKAYGDFAQQLATTSPLNVSAGLSVAQTWANALAIFRTTTGITPAVYQSFSIANSGTTTFTGTFTLPTRVGDTALVIAHSKTANLTDTTLTVKDSQGNLYAKIGDAYSSTGGHVQTTVFAAPIQKAGASNLLTITSSAIFTAITFSVIEMGGLGAVAPLGFPVGWWCELENLGPSTRTISSVATIDGDGPIILNPNTGIFLHFDGTNWWTERGFSAGPANTPAIAHEWLNSYNSSSAQFTQTQPAFSDISGTAQVAQGGTGTSTPSLVAGTNITITGAWPNQTVNSTGGGGGANVPLLPCQRFTSSDSNFANDSIWAWFFGSQLTNMPSTWKITMGCIGGTGIHVQAAVVYRTAPQSLVVTDVTTILFSGAATFNSAFAGATASAPFLVTCDAISAVLDYMHDYYVVWFLDNDGSGFNAALHLPRTYATPTGLFNGGFTAGNATTSIVGNTLTPTQTGDGVFWVVTT